MSNRSVTVVETIQKDRYKYCLVGTPDVGLAGSIAISYLIQEQQMTEVGYFESDVLPPVMVVHQGNPKPPVRIYSKGDIVAVISEIPIEPHLIPTIARSIIDWVQSKNIELLISLSGIAVQNRLDIDVPTVYGVGSTSSVKEEITRIEVEVFEEGFITGLQATLMKECLKKDIQNMILLVQSHLQYPDPGAAASLITSIAKLTNLKVDTKKLLAEEDEIRVKMRELMQRTQHQMQETQKGQEQEIPLMYV